MKFYKNILIPIILFNVLFMSTIYGQAENTAAAEPAFVFDMNGVLMIVAILLLIPLALLGSLFSYEIKRFLNELKSSNHGKTGMIILFLSSSVGLFAQDAAPAAAPVRSGLFQNFNGQTYTLLFLIALEILVMVFFIFQIFKILRPKLDLTATERQPSWWDKMNAFRPIEEEAVLDAGHNYDGIRELNNMTPPWFTITFLGSILFAIVYMYRYHYAYSAPLSIQEFDIEMKAAAKEDEIRLSNQANQVDENNVKVMDAASIDAGKAIFEEKCAACHQKHGGSMPGGVGPNLTDAYWLHGGSLKDIFKTIKYGWPEKGMIAWQDQLSPVQIAQTTNFIHSIKGSNPANAKEPQGDVYKEEAAAAEPAKVDSVQAK
jgi:cytochrome c oxidase cbb3-type subunit 3